MFNNTGSEKQIQMPEGEYERKLTAFWKWIVFGARSPREFNRSPRDFHTPPMSAPVPEVAKVEDLICSPGRKTRPPHLVVIVRGLPGSGKTYVSKLLRVGCCLMGFFGGWGVEWGLM